MEEENNDKTKETQKPKRFRKFAFATGIALTSLYILDVTDIPTKIMNFYQNSKERITDVLTISDEEKIESIYQSAEKYFSQLPDSLKERLVTTKIVEKDLYVKDIVNKLDTFQTDSLMYHLASHPNYPEKNVEYLMMFYTNLPNHQKWETAKEITKETLNLK